MKKYIFWLGVCIIIPIIIQMILADNMSFKWVACRRYLIIASLISYILSKVELSKKIMVNFFAMYFIMGTSVAFVYKYIKHSQVNGEFLWDEFTVSIGITSVFYVIMFLVDCKCKLNKIYQATISVEYTLSRKVSNSSSGL